MTKVRNIVYMVSRTTWYLEARIDQKRIWYQKKKMFSDQSIDLLRHLILIVSSSEWKVRINFFMELLAIGPKNLPWK